MKPLEVKGLTVRYGRLLAVCGLDMAVEEGEIVGLLGPNGAGKSTTLRVVTGLVCPDAGQVLVFGLAVPARRKEALGRLGALIEEAAFPRHLRARETLRLLGGLGGPVPASRVEEALELVGLADRASDRVGTYSRGMRKRLALALALLSRPRLLVLDEPTEGLDPLGVVEMREVVRRLNREEGTSVLYASHVLSEVERLCHRVVVLFGGRKVAEGRTAELVEGGGYLLRVRGDEERAAALLAGAGLPVEVTPDGLLLPDAEAAQRANALLVSRGVVVAGLYPRRRDLEAFFLEAVGDG